MKRMLVGILLIFFITGCSTGNKVDDEALNNIKEGLENRWAYTSTVENETSVEELEKGTIVELEALKKYDSDDFKDVSLYVLYDNYVRKLEQELHLLELAGISEKELGRDWYKHLENKTETLKNINEEYEIDISKEYEGNFKSVIEYTASSEGPGNDTELTELETMNYMEQITYRYLNASKMDNDTFEQKSELQACIGRVDSITEELKEGYPNDDPLALMIIDLGENVKVGCQDKLDGSHESDYDNSFKVGQVVGDISRAYMNGELPPTLKYDIQLNEAIKGKSN